MDDILHKSLSALKQWVDGQSILPHAETGLTKEEKKQFREVDRAIRNLEKLGVTIPDDLRRLKLELSAKDKEVSASFEAEARMKEMEEVMQYLRSILRALRGVKKGIRKSGKSSKSKKQYGVTVTDLLKDGYLSSKDKYEIKWAKDTGPYEGRIEQDGTVAVKVAGTWKGYDTLSGAAGDLAGRSVNGWWAWKRLEPDGKRVRLARIRARYLSERKK